MPDTPWITEVEHFTKISSDEILEGAAKWRKWRRVVGARNRAANAAPEITYPVFEYDATDLVLKYADRPVADIKSGAILVPQGMVSWVDGLVGPRPTYTNARYLEALKKSLEKMGLLDRQLVFLSNTRKKDALVKRLGFSLKDISEVVASEVDKISGPLSGLEMDILIERESQPRTRISPLFPYADEINDPDLKALAAAHKRVAPLQSIQAAASNLSGLPASMTRGSDGDLSNLIDRIDEKFPLLDIRGWMRYNLPTEHSILYMKAVIDNEKDV